MRFSDVQNSVVRTSSPKQRDIFNRISRVREAIFELSPFCCIEVSQDLLALNSFTNYLSCQNCFGFSVRSFLLYAQIADEGGRLPGLFIHNHDSAFALGIFVHDGQISAHIIAPQGANKFSATIWFSKWILKLGFVDSVYIRHILPEDAQIFEQLGCLHITKMPWRVEAPCEDETFNHRIINLHSAVNVCPDGEIQVKDLIDPDCQNHRKKFRLGFQRGQNFLHRNNFSFTLRPLQLSDTVQVQVLIENHFSLLRSSGKELCSTAIDYGQLVSNFYEHDKHFISLVGVLEFEGRERICAVYLGEKIGEKAGAIYCNICCRDAVIPKQLNIKADVTGLTALPQYAMACLFGRLLSEGWSFLDLGGSESLELDRSKRQLGATARQTTWVIATAC